MSKFPLLNTYRTIAIIGAVLLVIIGALAALSAATMFSRSFNLLGFIGAFLPFGGAAFGLGVVAELIVLVLRIEDHLDAIRQVQTKGATVQSPPQPPPQMHPLAASTPRTRKPVSSSDADLITLQATISVASASIRFGPGENFTLRGQLNAGEQVILYARDARGNWAEIDGDAQHWLKVTELEIDGDLSVLPVVAPF